MAWELLRKTGKSVSLGGRFDQIVEKRASVENGYAWRHFDADGIRFCASSAPRAAPLPPERTKEDSAISLPGTIGSFIPSDAHGLPAPALLEDVFFSLVKTFRDRSRGRIKVLSADLQAGASVSALRNSRGAWVEWGATHFSVGLTLETPAGRVALPLASREIHRFRLEETFPFLDPYFRLPLPEKPPPAGRLPAVWSSLCGAFFLARMGERIKDGNLSSGLPEGFELLDDPIHPAGLVWAFVDGEGRKTRKTDVRKVRIADAAQALRSGVTPTGHARRDSAFDPPATDYHNLYLDGPPGLLPEHAPVLFLTVPLRMDWLDGDRFSFHAQAFTLAGGVPTAFHPAVHIRATVKDVLASLHFTLPPVRFFPFNGSTGAPGLAFKGLNFCA